MLKKVGEPRSERLRLMAIALVATAFPLVPGLSAQQSPDTLWILQAATLAVEAHPSVGMARRELQGARALEAEARAEWLPSLATQGRLSRFQEPMVVAPFHGLDPNTAPLFHQTLLRGSIGLGYTLFDGGARSARSEGAEAGGMRARAGLEGSKMDLIRSVLEAYLGVLTNEDVLEAHRQRIRALEEERDRSRQLFDQGAAPRVEVLRAGASLSQARADARSAEIRLAVARRELARLTGMNEDALATTVLPPAAFLGAPVEEEPPLPSRLEPPEVEAAAHGVTEAERARNVARAAWLPTLRADAAFEEFGSGDGDFTGEWQAGLQVSYPIFTGGRRAATNELAEARLGRARQALALARLRARSEADRAVSALEDALARADALEATVVQFQEVARIEALALEAGSGVQRDLLAAEASLLAARAQLAEARHASLMARASLARVRGELTLEWLQAHFVVAPEEASP